MGEVCEVGILDDCVRIASGRTFGANGDDVFG